MAETKPATKGPRRAAEEAPTDALRARIADILYRSRKPLSVGELLKRLKFPPKRAGLLVTYLATLAREGHIKRVNTGVYAANTVAARAPSPPPPLSRAALHQLIAQSRRVLTTEDICVAAHVPPHRRHRVLTWLAELVVEGLVRRVRKGVYAPLDPIKSATPSPMSMERLDVMTTAPPLPMLIKRLRTAIETSDRAMTADEIMRAAKVPPHQLRSASVLIGRLATKGLVRRVHPGVYASLKIVKSALPPQRVPLLYQLREVVDRGARAMTIAEILAAARVPEERRLSATGMLSKLVRKGLVRRVDAGVYAPLHEAVALASPTMEASILAALAKHPEGLDVATLCARVRADDEELDEAIRALLRGKRVRRVRLGVYVATA